MKALLVALTLSVTSACSGRSFPAVEGTTRVEVRTNHDSLGTITHRERIAAILSFVNEHRTDWEQPWAGVPIGKLGVTLFRDREVQGSFTVVDGFFESQREGDFFSRDAQPEVIARFRSLLAPYSDVGRPSSSMSRNER